MPLAFQSISHGAVAFGFFNIESDMLLLGHTFFFASDFCRLICRMARKEREETFHEPWEVYHITNAQDIGDLGGAIQGIGFRGFIGELYKRFPFPALAEAFRQNPEGFKTRALVEKLIHQYATWISIFVSANPVNQECTIGQYRFNKAVFQELVQYVWPGGYPTWNETGRPVYVTLMKEEIERSSFWLLRGMAFRK